MMAAIFNSAILNSATTILDSDTLLSSLRFTEKHSHSNLTLNQTHSIWLKLIPSHVTWWWQPSWILPILDSAILQRINFTYSFWLNLMMAAIFNSAMLDSAITILDSDTLLSSLRFAQKHSHSNLTLTQTNSIWLKLIHSDLNLMMAAILNSANLNSTILDSAILVFSLKLTHTCQHWFPPFAQKNFTHSFWLNLMMAAILKYVMLDSDTAILDSDTLLSSLRFTQHYTLTPPSAQNSEAN